MASEKGVFRRNLEWEGENDGILGAILSVGWHLRLCRFRLCETPAGADL
jgi:hypothetical protein